MVAAIEFKRCMTGTDVFRMIVGELSYREKSSPVILLIIDKDTEICFYSTVLLVCLAFSLRVKGRREPFFDPQQVTKR